MITRLDNTLIIYLYLYKQETLEKIEDLFKKEELEDIQSPSVLNLNIFELYFLVLH